MKVQERRKGEERGKKKKKELAGSLFLTFIYVQKADWGSFFSPPAAFDFVLTHI